jgi:hypothetical protein
MFQANRSYRLKVIQYMRFKVIGKKFFTKIGPSKFMMSIQAGGLESTGHVIENE